MKGLDTLRNSIDKLDSEILTLLNKRMSMVKSIGELKNKQNSTIYRPERERDILSRLEKLSKKQNGLLTREALEAIYGEIFAVSRNLEKAQSVAYLGPEGSYTHQAAHLRFGALSSYLALASIEAVFKELKNKQAKFGVVPVENNTAGAVGVTLDCLAEYEELKIFGEICMDIHHSFVSLSSDIKGIKRIYSHPQGYEQCRLFLENHQLDGVEFIASKSTANAAFLASKDAEGGAICSKIAAKLYKVPILFDRIEDNGANRTRFLILSDEKFPFCENCKTSIFVHTRDEAGALADLLSVFKRANINLTKLESRPVQNANSREFNHSFYIDFEGHIEEDRVKKALSEIKAEKLLYLGSYLVENGE